MNRICEPFSSKIYIAGDYTTASNICKDYCNQVGLCVNISKCDYIYIGGCESGVVVELINYPRFPTTIQELEQKSIELANLLRDGLYQDSYTIMGRHDTIWFSSRYEEES